MELGGENVRAVDVVKDPENLLEMAGAMEKAVEHRDLVATIRHHQHLEKTLTD